MTAQIVYLDRFAAARRHIASDNPTIREAAADVLAASTDPEDAWAVYQARKSAWRREIRQPLPHYADLRDGALLQQDRIDPRRVLILAAGCIAAAAIGALAMNGITALVAWQVMQ